jgi:acetyl esterase
MPFVRPDVRAFLDLLEAQGGPQIHELDPPNARQLMLGLVQLADRPRGELARAEDFTIDTGAHSIPARLYSADGGREPGPVLVFYHGGGWVIGDLDSHDPLCAEIARGLGMTVVSIDYRLAPEHRFPAAVEDSLAATRWLAGSPAVVGHRVTGLVLAGDSAGGNLTAVCAQHLAGTLPVPILAQWLIYPGVDMTWDSGSMLEFAQGYLITEDSMQWFVGHYLSGEEDPLDLRASPLLREDLSAQPPALVFTCGLDPLRDQARAYAAKLFAHGEPTVYREAAGQIHGSFNLRQGIPSAQEDLLGCLKTLSAIVDEASAAAPEAMPQAAE